MKKDLEMRRPSGSRRMYEPRVIGDIINEMLLSNEPLANAFRNWLAEREKTRAAEEQSKVNRLFVDIYPNTEPCIDLKLLTQQPGRMDVGAILRGILTRDGEEHYTFRETQPSTAGKRNQQVFYGKFITITRRDDGTLRPNFKPVKMEEGFSASSYATGVANELLWALTSLLGK